MRTYTALEMLYATHVIEGLRTLDKVPANILEAVTEIVEKAKSEKKEEGAE